MAQIDRFSFGIPGGPSPAPQRLGCLFALSAVVVFAMLLAAQLAERNRERPTSGNAPAFDLRLFDGGDISLENLRGTVVLLNFWASWCPPCRAEADDLQALHTDYAEAGLRVIGVNMLESSRTKATEFLRKYGISYSNGEDIGQTIARQYRVAAPPESYLIDRRGQVRKVFIGSLTYDEAHPIVESLLAEAA